ncbi:hypothetical protein V6Z11_A11G350100 [Gossypium hirsutum]
MQFFFSIFYNCPIGEEALAMVEINIIEIEMWRKMDSFGNDTDQ